MTARWSAIDEGRTIVVHPRRWSSLFFALAAIWNGLGAWWSRGADLTFTLIASLGVLLFAYFAARSLADVFVRFDDGKMVVRAKPFYAIARPDFELSIADIEALVAGEDDPYEAEGHAVFVVLKGSGAKKRVPLPLAGFLLRSRGARRPFAGGVSFDEARVVAEALNESLDIARRSATHYRVMAAAVPAPREEDEAEEVETDGTAVTRKRGSR